MRNCGLAKHKRARITIASTRIYGDPEVHPQHEEYFGHVNTIGPRGATVTKHFRIDYDGMPPLPRTGDTHCSHLQHLRAAQRQSDSRVLPAFIGQALRGEFDRLY